MPGPMKNPGDPRDMEMLEGDPLPKLRNKKYRLDRVRCLECDRLGRLQYRSTRMRAGGPVISLKCKACGAWRHVSEEKLLS